MASTRGQRIGLAVSGVLMLAVVGWIGVAVLTAGPEASAQDADAGDPDRFEDILEVLETSGAVTGMNVTMTDPDDPTRRRAVITAERAHPIELHTYEVTAPVAMLYLRDGRVAHVRADRGVFEGFDLRRKQAPSAGRLEGSVIVRVFAPKPGGVDPENDEPLMTGWLEKPGGGRDVTLNFDFRIGEVTTPDRLFFSSEQLDYQGTEVRILFSEVNERVELFTSQRDNRLTIYLVPKGVDRPEPGDAQTADASGSGGGAGPDPLLNPEPILEEIEEFTLYRLKMRDNVVVQQEGRRIVADDAVAYARTVDNSIPDQGWERPKKSGAGSLADHLLSAVFASQPEIGGLGDRDLGDFMAPVMLTWGGLLEFQPITEEPEELGGDDIAALFSARAPGELGLEWAELGATGQGDELLVRSPSRSFELSSEKKEGARIDVTGAGGVSGREIGGSALTGVGQIVGAGEVRYYPEGMNEVDPERPQRVTWTERADFVFDPDTAALLTAMFTGGAEGVSAESFIRGEFVRVELEADESGESRLRRLSGEGGVVVGDGRGGRLRGETIEASFADGTHGFDFDPSYLVVNGGVVAERPGDLLRCGRLEAELARDAEGRVEVRGVVAEEHVEFAGRDEVEATGETLRGNVAERRIEVTGEGARVGRGETSIEGSAITLDGERRSAEVFGAGSFDHVAGEQEFSASWTTSMRFDDTSGELECIGGVTASSKRGDRQRDTIACDELAARLEPGPDADPDGEGYTIDGERRVLSVRASGESLQKAGGVPARIRSWTYAEGDPEVVERLAFLEGDEILADNDAGTLEVPSAGTLVIADLREAGSAEDDSLAGNTRGRSRFLWRGSMLVERDAGRITFSRDVELQHTRESDAEQTDLMCESLVATTEVESDEASAVGARPTGRLVSAEASGAVYLRSGDREVAADHILYDASSDTAEISATPGNRITVFDALRGTAATAESMLWDLASDRVELRRPGRIVAPTID